MTNFDYDLSDAMCAYDFESKPQYSVYDMMFFLAGLAFISAASSVLTKSSGNFFESFNRLDYEEPNARKIAGFLRLVMLAFHTDGKDVVFKKSHNKGRLLAIVPHRAGTIEGIGLTSKLTGSPPCFFATDGFDSIPYVKRTRTMFKTITVEDNTDKKVKVPSNAVELGVKALKNGETVAIFPQGGFSRIGEEPLRVYAGAARMAIEANMTMDVIRLDGIWALENSFIPVAIRNNTFYRAFFSAFHLNKMTARACAEIDFHLKEENQYLSEEDKIEEICAQLYAYGRHTEALSDEQLKLIDLEIEEGRHLPIWRNKVELCDRQKALKASIKENPKLTDALKEEQEVLSMLKTAQDEREEVIFASPLRLCL